MHNRCCCPPESARPGLIQYIFDLVPQGGLFERIHNQFIHIPFETMNARAPGDVVVDGFGKWVWFLEDHPDTVADFDRVYFRGIQVLSLKG